MKSLLVLLTVHFVADFVFQSDWMALNKSKNWRALWLHTATYSVCFLPLAARAAGPELGLLFVGLTWATHTIQDALTSRWTAKLWFLDHVPTGAARWRDLGHDVSVCQPAFWVDVKPTRHWFFVVIGLDQLLHTWTLALTWVYITGSAR